MRRSVLVVGVIAATVLAPTASAFADNPPGQGPPGQSCQDLGLTTPGNAANSPGSPFNEPSGNNLGGTGGQNYSQSSQYDVACFQQFVHSGR